jgi:hypothetical protein
LHSLSAHETITQAHTLTHTSTEANPYTTDTMKFASSIIALLAIGTSSVLARPTGPVAAPACICETVHGAVTELQTVVSGAAEKICSYTFLCVASHV